MDTQSIYNHFVQSQQHVIIVLRTCSWMVLMPHLRVREAERGTGLAPAGPTELQDGESMTINVARRSTSQGSMMLYCFVTQSPTIQCHRHLRVPTIRWSRCPPIQLPFPGGTYIVGSRPSLTRHTFGHTAPHPTYISSRQCPLR